MACGRYHHKQDVKTKLLILGVAKSGTSILAFRAYSGLPMPKSIAFEPAGFASCEPDCEPLHRQLCFASSTNLVTKCLVNPQFDPAWDRVHRCGQYYNRKVWIARDPRDRLISYFFYYPYWGNSPANPAKKGQFVRMVSDRIAMTKKKEADPLNIPFYLLYPDAHKLRAGEMRLYENLCANWRSVQREFQIIKYEDLVNQKTLHLNDYLGFSIDETAELPHKFRRVKRTKAYGNWRRWFTDQDVAFFKPVYQRYMELVGYDMTDWNLTYPTQLPAQEGSMYLEQVAYDETL